MHTFDSDLDAKFYIEKKVGNKKKILVKIGRNAGKYIFYAGYGKTKKSTSLMI